MPRPEVRCSGSPRHAAATRTLRVSPCQVHHSCAVSGLWTRKIRGSRQGTSQAHQIYQIG